MLNFAQPWFLLALGGLILPLLIHRISRSRPVAWPFPSIARIRKTPLPRQGKRQISDWPLLLLRMLLLALLILALAGPQWIADEGAAPAAAGRQSAVVLVDASSSMSGWGAPGQIREELDTLDASFRQSAWGWVVFADEVLQSSGSAANNGLSSLEAFLNENPPLPVAGFPAAGIREALGMLADNEGINRLHIISDFQESDWSRSRLPEIPAHVEVFLHPVGDEQRSENLALQRVLPLPAEDDQTRILATSINFGTQPVDTRLRLTTSEGTFEREISLSPGRQQTEAFLLPNEGNTREASIEIVAGDPYPRDNSVSFSPSAPPAPEILAVDPEGGLTAFSEEVFFLTQALAAAYETDWGGYDVLPVGLDPVNPQTLERTSAVFIPANAFANPDLPWNVLRSYIQNGGLVVATMDSEAVRGIDNLNRAGFPEIGYRGIAGRGLSERFYVGPVPDGSLLDEVFTGEATRDLFLLGIYQFARLTLPGEASPLLETDDGDPLLVNMPVGKGQLVLSAFPWDRSVTDLPLRPSFLPIAREVFSLAGSETASVPESRNLIPAPLSESLPQRMPVETVERLLRGGSTQAAADRFQAVAADGPDRPATDLAPWILLFACLMFISECLLARRLITAT